MYDCTSCQLSPYCYELKPGFCLYIFEIGLITSFLAVSAASPRVFYILRIPNPLSVRSIANVDTPLYRRSLRRTSTLS